MRRFYITFYTKVEKYYQDNKKEVHEEVVLDKYEFEREMAVYCQKKGGRSNYRILEKIVNFVDKYIDIA